MKWQGETLVKVRAHDELRAGMGVLDTAACEGCDRHHWHTLVRFDASDRRPCSTCENPRGGWVTVDSNDHYPNETNCFVCAIAAGKLYRLRDIPDAKEVTRERELERAR